MNAIPFKQNLATPLWEGKCERCPALSFTLPFPSFTLFSTTQVAPELAPDYRGIGKQYLPREVKTVPGKKPNKKELARMKVLSDMGESN